MNKVNVDNKVDTVYSKKKTYEISRKDASKRLGVSVRTIDRYIHSGKLSTHSKNGRKWLNLKEIEVVSHVDNVDSVDSQKSTEKSESTPIDTVDMVSTSMSTPPTSKEEENIYKKLYEELREEFRHQQDRLEGANYRVGQLESQLKNTIPLLEYNQSKVIHQEQKEKMTQEIQEFKKEVGKVSRELKIEQFTKRIYLIALFSLLTLQLLWLYLSVIK